MESTGEIVAFGKRPQITTVPTVSFFEDEPEYVAKTKIPIRANRAKDPINTVLKTDKFFMVPKK
mgnify:CR=1 FL=1